MAGLTGSNRPGWSGPPGFCRASVDSCMRPWYNAVIFESHCSWMITASSRVTATLGRVVWFGTWRCGETDAPTARGGRVVIHGPRSSGWDRRMAAAGRRAITKRVASLPRVHLPTASAPPEFAAQPAVYHWAVFQIWSACQEQNNG